MSSSYNSSPENNSFSEFNTFTYIVLALQCIGSLVGLFMGIFTTKLNPAIGYLTITTSLVVLVALILIMACTSKWGLYLFFAAKLISGITASAILGAEGQSEVMRAVLACVVLGVVLFLQKDGVSGWSVLFEKTNYESSDTSSGKGFKTFVKTNWMYIGGVALGLAGLAVMVISLIHHAKNYDAQSPSNQSANAVLADSAETLMAESTHVPSKTFECELLSFRYPGTFTEDSIENAPHMVLKLESDECFCSISYWDYGIDDSVDVWDDNIVDAYAGANIPQESEPKVERIHLTLGGDDVHAVRIISESSHQVEGYTVTIRYYSYMVIHKGYLLEFCFTGAPYDGDCTYYEGLLKGVTLK